MKRPIVLSAAMSTVLLSVVACGSSSSGGSTTASSTGTTSPSASCAPSSLHTRSAGVLTIGADQPVFPPWFIGNNPLNGKGFEGAVDAAVARQLGYSPSQVKLTRVTFDQAIQQPQRFDFDLDEYSITPARQKVVDFSAPYYDVTQAVVTVAGSKAAGVTSLAGLKPLKLGVQVGTTALSAVTDTIKPAQQPGVFNTNSDVLQALKNGQVDAVIVDLPTAFYMTAVQLSKQHGVIVGQLPATGGKQEQFGALLAKGSPLTSCVSQAIDTLRRNGTLASIQQKWLAEAGKAPVLS